MPIRSRHSTVTAAATLIILSLAAAPQTPDLSSAAPDPAVFKTPPAEFRGQQMFGYGLFNLSTLSRERIASAIENMARQNMGGFAPEPGGGPTTGLPDDYLKATRRNPSTQGVVYLSEEYFQLYRFALEEARKRGMRVVLYD